MSKNKETKTVRSFYPCRKLIVKIQKLAKEEGRSFSSMVVYLLERALGAR